MSREMSFFIYLIERYADSKATVASKIMKQWDENGISSMVYDMYELYHCETLENAFEDIDLMIAERNS